MYLSKLEIFGFKSFADKTTIEFDSGVSAIVGPNGSGKSNIVDALRWVLGEQGDKILRSGKREDVVFNGTKFRKPLSVAEVAVTIQNNNNKLPVEYSEVQIARRFYRSGETEYYLNGTKVRLKDIKELFIDTGIGPDAYSVIELKMVETILSDIKHERRKLFEEAAGVVSYKHNRDLTFNRLDSVHESLLRVNDIIREKQRNVNALERQAKRNEEAKLVSEELKSLELKVSAFEFIKLITEISDIKSKEETNLNLKATLSEEVRENDITLDKYRIELEESDKALTEINNKLSDEKKEINIFEKDNLVLGEKISNLTNDISRLLSENEQLIISKNKNLERLSDLNDRIKVLKNTIYISEISLKEKKAKVDASIKVINEKKNEMIELGKKLKEVNKTVSDNNSEYQKNKINYENNLLQLEKLSGLNAAHLTDIDKIQIEKNKLDEELKEFLLKLKTSEKELKEKEEEKRLLSVKLSDKEKEISENKIEEQIIKSRIDHLTSMSENFEDYAEGVKYLVKDIKEKGIITILDSIEVEDKFKIAIETALGEVSNYLIVDDSKRVDSFIDMLSEHKKGKVTFILNDILNYKTFDGIPFSDIEPDFIGTKGVYGFADKYVKCVNDKYILLMSYILDEYVIVDNVSTAKRLAEDNYYKFITLEGDIITKGFIRSGGEVNEESVKLGRQKKIDELVEKAKESGNLISGLNNELEVIKKDHESISLEIFKNNFDKVRKECERIERETANLDFRKEQLNKSITENENSYNSIKESNNKLNEIINNLIAEVNKSENEQYNLDKELIFLTDEFNLIEQDYSHDSTDYNNFNLELTKIRNELKNEEQNLSRVTNSVSYNEKQLASNTETISVNQKTLVDHNTKLSLNTEKIRYLNEGIVLTEEKFSIEKRSYDEKKSHQHKIDVEQRQRRIDLDNVSQKLINAQIKIKENEIKSEQIKDYVLKKYEKDISASDSISDFENVFGDFDYAPAKQQVEELSERLKKLGGGYQQILFEDFENEKAELEKMVEQKNDLLESEKDIRKTIEKINKEARERFLGTFEQIKDNFIRIFKELFSEGDEANLRIVYEEDEDGKLTEDPLEAKIEIVAKPRGKRPTSIELLSGGEKTLTAIALLFAIYLVKPSPFCVLDEVDAPLDVANLGRFNKMIRKFSDNTQFILITHNERTMESVDRLYGVTMQEAGITTIVETKFKNDEKLQA
ncbi:MAG: chromosome segregation protein SMC [Ignavibacteria bacterium]|nr:chromosome segregation protein SMC [Ignavibacteria bacterium]